MEDPCNYLYRILHISQDLLGSLHMYPCRILQDPCNYPYSILHNPRTFQDHCTCILAGSCRIPGSSRILATVLTGSCRISGSSRILVHVYLQDPAESQDPQGFLQLSLQHPAQSQDLLGSLHMYPCRILKDPCNYSYRILQNSRIFQDPCTCLLTGSCRIPGSLRVLVTTFQDPTGIWNHLKIFLRIVANFLTDDSCHSLIHFGILIIAFPLQQLNILS